MPPLFSKTGKLPGSVRNHLYTCRGTSARVVNIEHPDGAWFDLGKDWFIARSIRPNWR